MRDVLELLLAERYGTPPRTDQDTAEDIRARQRLLAEMPGDEHPSEIKGDERD